MVTALAGQLPNPQSPEVEALRERWQLLQSHMDWLLQPAQTADFARQSGGSRCRHRRAGGRCGFPAAARN